MAYNYRDLDTSKREIRLISLSPGTSDEIQCDILYRNLDNANKYYTLSYLWGEPEKDDAILLDGTRKVVRPNLFQALRHLRDYIPGELIWVDALCIDQLNATERSSQVNMMGDIYESSVETISWLGAEADESPLAMELLSSITTNVQNISTSEADILTQVETIAADSSERRKRSWIALRKLFERAYWTRAWIIQEVFLSHPTSLLCGKDTCKWDDVY